MTDTFRNPNQSGGRFENSRESNRGINRGGRGPNNREGGGFRIRLSDNEMRAARSLQEAFQLRSTVAVLGFALRTLGQMLEEGKLSDLVNEYRSQTDNGPGRPIERAKINRKDRFNDSSRKINADTNKPNPFARPEKPQQKEMEEDLSIDQDSKEKEGSENSLEELKGIENAEEQTASEADSNKEN